MERNLQSKKKKIRIRALFSVACLSLGFYNTECSTYCYNFLIFIEADNKTKLKTPNKIFKIKILSWNMYELKCMVFYSS